MNWEIPDKLEESRLTATDNDCNFNYCVSIYVTLIFVKLVFSHSCCDKIFV